MDMMRLAIVIVAASVVAVFVAYVVQGRYPTPRLVVVESSLVGTSTAERLKIQMRSRDEHQNLSGLVGTERGVSGIVVKLHNHVEIGEAVVEDSFVARADGGTSRCHGSGPVVQQAPSAVVETQDDPSQYRAVFGLKEVRDGVGQAVATVDRNRDSLHLECSKTQGGLSCGCFREGDPAWGFERTAPS
jgi:hypothetical protein